jgi:sialidase-1
MMLKTSPVTLFLSLLCFVATAGLTASAEIHRNVLLPPGPENPRNSEGDFIELNDGRVMFVYTHFTGGKSDHATAHLAARFSSDDGLSWTDEDVMVLANEGGFNVMSVSLLRLPTGAIGLVYMVKNSLEDCRPVMRTSTDEGETWSDPVAIITDQVGYYVLNNDRIVMTADGRLLCPVALHNTPDYDEPDWDGILMVYYSDDLGQTWRRSASSLRGFHDDGSRVLLQEPGVIELQDGRIMMWARTNSGVQYLSWSTDRGDTWSAPVPSSIPSPRSPASIERIPGRDELMMVWNDVSSRTGEARTWRTPLTVALSEDDGVSWGRSRTLENNSDGWYCYTAIEFVGDRVLLAHCAGLRTEGALDVTQMTSFGLDWLLAE